MLDTTLTPYRLHFHRRIASELGVRLLSLHLHERDFFPWTLPTAGLELISLAPAATTLPSALAKAREILALLRRERVAALVVGGWGDPVRAAVLLGARLAGIPCIVFGDSNARNDPARGSRHLIKRAALPLLLRGCSAVLACGRLGREFFQRYGVPPERIHLCPYEPHYALFTDVPEERQAEVAARLRLSDGRRRLVFAGRLAPEKRVDLLLSAFQDVAALRPEWDLVIVGEGPLQAALQRQAEPLGERARFLGFLDVPDVAAVFRSCHALVLPSDMEPWGVVVNEALAAGLALVCSDVVGAAADLLEEGMNGRGFPAGSRQALVTALLDVTERGRLATYRREAPQVLARWRRTADPVAGLAAALGSIGLEARSDRGPAQTGAS